MGKKLQICYLVPQFLLRISGTGHVRGDHELLEVDAAVPVLVENTEQLLQKLVASLALCR